MRRLREILARRYWRLTGWQWLLVAVVIGVVGYVYWRRRVEAEGFEEGVEGEEDRGGASTLDFEPAPVDYVEIPASELDEGFDDTNTTLLEDILITLEGISETIAPPSAAADGELPRWRQRIAELRERSKERRAQTGQRIEELRAGGVTQGERRNIRRIRERQRASAQRTRERIQGIRQRHASTAPVEAAPTPASSRAVRPARRAAPIVHTQATRRATPSRTAPLVRPAARTPARGGGGRRRGR